MSVDVINRKASSVRLPDGGTLTVTDDRGAVLASSGPTQVTVGKVAPLAQSFVGKKAGDFTSGNDRYAFTTVQTLPAGQPLYVLAGAPVKHGLRYALLVIL